MAKRFYSRVSPWIWITIWGSVLLTWVLCFPIFYSNEGLLSKVIVSLTLIGTTALLASVFFNTYYYFSDKHIHWVTGPFKGKVSIDAIREIRRASSMMDISGMIKPTLSSKPLLIKYNKYEDIPMSPLAEEEFLSEIK